MPQNKKTGKTRQRKTPFKTPCNPFIQFVRLHTKDTVGSPVNYMSQLAQQWKTCPESVKNQCKQMAEREMKIYRAKKQEYQRTRPLRPLSGYQVFVQDYLKRNKNNHKDQKNLFSAAAGQWKNLDESEKQRWKLESEERNKKRCQGRKLTQQAKKSVAAARKRKPSSSSAIKKQVKKRKASASGLRRVKSAKKAKASAKKSKASSKKRQRK